MTVLNLPQINFNSNPGYNSWEFLHQIYSQEFFLRTQIGSTYGIVDTVNPTSAPLSTARPLYVSTNASNPQALDITKGYAITPNFQLIIIDSNLSAVPLPSVIDGTAYVVCLEYTLVPSVDQQVNRYGILTELRDERPSNTPYGDQVGVDSTLSQAVTIATLTDFNNVSIFPQDRKKGLVVIAVVTVQVNTQNTPTLSVDLTQTTYTFNRPWFSPVDIFHRSEVGSGVVTSTNPHGTSIQDLSSSGFTLYEQLVPRGGVFAKDATYYGYPGTFCTELISLNRYEMDATGQVTADSSLQLDPLTGRYYVTLTKVPVRMGSLYIQGTPWKPIPYYWKPGTRYLILGTLEQPLDYGSSLTVEYFSVSALMPPAESLTQGVQNFQVTDPISGSEYIITGGLSLDALNNDTLNLSSAVGPIKKAYQVICSTEGALVTSPQNLVPVLSVPTLVSQGTININQAPLNGAGVTWLIGLTGAPTNPPSSALSSNLNLQILINGIDDIGGTVEETITFYASQWADQFPTGLVEQPLQFRTTVNKYQLINYVQIVNTTTNPDNAGSAAILSMWANILESSTNQELANVASFFWDGLGARRVTDTRIIGTTLQRDDQREYSHPNLLPETSAGFIQELFSVIFNPPLVDPSMLSTRLALESDADRQVSETWNVFSDLPATGTIQVVNFTYITPNMTIKIADGVVLTFVTTPPISDPTVGQVAIPQSLITGSVEILNNIVTTVNNATFDSSWFASLGTNTVTLTRAESYPPGFTVCYRQAMRFTGNFTAGTIQFSVAGHNIGPVTALGTHALSLDAIVQAVNTENIGITAVHVSDPTLDYIIFNGAADGTSFLVTTPVFTGAVVLATISSPPDAFTITSPINGELPTQHIPNRFVSNEIPWQYLSRAIEWVNVGLQATIAFGSNDPSAISDGDQVEIVPGKILIARNAIPTPSITRSLGQFLVTPSSLLATLESMRDTINDPTFASGCEASIDPTNTKLLIKIGGYGSASIQLLLEANANTWLVSSYAPVGIGPVGSTGFLKALYPLASAQWRYQLIEPSVQIGTFNAAAVAVNPSNTITLNNHGLTNGSVVYFVASSNDYPSGLVPNQKYYVINVTNNTFQLSLTSGGASVIISTPGSSNNVLYVDQPFGPGQWSPYIDMEFISPTAFRFSSGPGGSIYAVQVKLVGQGSLPNSFSLYQVSPETGATNAALAARLFALDGGIPNPNAEVAGEIVAARGTENTLNQRLSVTINPDGSRIQDPELIDARSSMVLPAGVDLKSRLDLSDEALLWVNLSNPNYISLQSAGGNKLVSGAQDIQGNANFLTVSGSTVRISGNTPLVVGVNGNTYRFARDFDLDFSSVANGDYYINAEIRSISETFPPANVNTSSYVITITSHGLLVGDRIEFSTSGVLPTGLVTSTTYFVKTVPSANTFTVSATNGGSTQTLTTQGTGTHTVLLKDQYLGQTVFTGNVTSAIVSGSKILNATGSNFGASLGSPSYAMNDLIFDRYIPLIVWIPSLNTTTIGGITYGGFISPVLAALTGTSLEILGEFPNVPLNTYFEIRSPQECSLTLTPFVAANYVAGTAASSSNTRLAIGQAGWSSPSFDAAKTLNFRYLDRYVSDIKGPYSANPNYTSDKFTHNLGRIPGSFKLYYHTTSTGDIAPVLVENDAIFQVTTTTVQVKNRYTLTGGLGLIVKDFSGANISSGAYLQLIIS